VRSFTEGKTGPEIEEELSNDRHFAFLTSMPAFSLPSDADSENVGDRKFKRGTKTAAFFATALPGAARCHLCGALVHRNSIQFDHDTPRRSGGSAALENAKVSHPYCNSIKDHLVGADTVLAP
jgi:HNH endonuclease